MKLKCTTAVLTFLFSTNLSFSQTQKYSDMKPFKVQISPEQINDLHNRINNTRWIVESGNSGWNNGLDIAFLKSIATYWANDFDWNSQEFYLNSFEQFKSKVNDIDIHFVYEKSEQSDKIPLLLLHGWASNFTEFLNTIRLIKKEHPNIEIVAPSIPGFGFSDAPSNMSSENVADYIHQLMTEGLGYDKYYVHGGDYGAFIGEKLALKYPQAILGLHLSDIPFYHLYLPNENLSEVEAAFIENVNNWSMMDGAYAMIQGTRPKILSTGLNDSPMALAAWILQLYHDFGNKEKTLLERFNQNELLTNICIYWFNQKIYSSMRMYAEDMSGYEETSSGKVKVPVGFYFNEHDITGIPPRKFAERFFEKIVTWTEHQDAGHFSSLSHPKPFQEDLIHFIQKVENDKK